VYRADGLIPCQGDWDEAGLCHHAVPIDKHPEEAVSRLLVLSFSTSRHSTSTFGEYIKKARLEKGLRQRDVVEAIWVSEMTIVNWEKRRCMPRRYATVRRLCDALGLS